MPDRAAAVMASGICDGCCTDIQARKARARLLACAACDSYACDHVVVVGSDGNRYCPRCWTKAPG